MIFFSKQNPRKKTRISGRPGDKESMDPATTDKYRTIWWAHGG